MCTKSCYNRVVMGIGSFGRIWFNLSDAEISILRAKLTITTTGDARALYVAWHQQPEHWPCRINSIQWRHNERECVSNHQPHDCLLNRLFKRSKDTSKFRVTGLCTGISPVTGEFPARRASNAENASIWWRHHVVTVFHRKGSEEYGASQCWKMQLYFYVSQNKFNTPRVIVRFHHMSFEDPGKKDMTMHISITVQGLGRPILWPSPSKDQKVAQGRSTARPKSSPPRFTTLCGLCIEWPEGHIVSLLLPTKRIYCQQSVSLRNIFWDKTPTIQRLWIWAGTSCDEGAGGVNTYSAAKPA